MKIGMFCTFFLLIISLSFASELSDLQRKIKNIDFAANIKLNTAKTAKTEEAEEAAHQWYFLQKDRLSAGKELIRLPDFPESKRSELLKDYNSLEDNLDTAYQSLLKSITDRTPPEVSSVSAIEIDRSDYYVTYSVSVDVKNEGEPREFFINVAGVQYDGRELDDTIIRGVIDQGESETLTGTCMVKTKFASNIRDWKVSKLNYYKRR